MLRETQSVCVCVCVCIPVPVCVCVCEPVCMCVPVYDALAQLIKGSYMQTTQKKAAYRLIKCHTHTHTLHCYAARHGSEPGLKKADYRLINPPPPCIVMQHGTEASQAIKMCGAKVRYGVDATQLSTKIGEGYDYLVFNFPHTGNNAGLAESIKSNRKLLRQCFSACPRIVRYVTLSYHAP